MLVYLLFLDKKIFTLVSSTTLKTHSLAPEQVYYESHALKMIDFEQKKDPLKPCNVYHFIVMQNFVMSILTSKDQHDSKNPD